MKYILPALVFAFGFSGCINSNNKIVEQAYTDSLTNHFTHSKAIKSNELELDFWKNRVNPRLPGISNELKYARTLISKFHLSGDIKDLQEAEISLKQIDITYKGKESAVYTSLAETALLQHQFIRANEYLQKAKQLGIESYISNSLSFDVEFELGRFDIASFYLKKMKSPVDYGYHFRKAKLFHLNGKPDSASTYMIKAASLAPKKSNLQGIALANAADFYIHTGKLEEAADLYKTCIKINSDDFDDDGPKRD